MPPRKVPNRRDLTERNLDANVKRDRSQHEDIAALEARVETLEALTKILLDPPWARRKDRMPPKVTP
jgi:hypothetical protein